MLDDLKLKIFTTESPISSSEFEQFMALMVLSFPKEERRTKEAFLELCNAEAKYKIYALFKGNELIAFFTIWEFESFSFGDHFAVNPSFRSGGIGTQLLKQIEENCRLPLVLEVELPDGEIEKRRLNFYLRNGFKENKQDYLLPPMQEGCVAVPMRILSFPELLCDGEFDKVKSIIYKKVYNVD